MLSTPISYDVLSSIPTPRLESLFETNEAPLKSELSQLHMHEENMAREFADIQTTIPIIQKQIDLLADKLSVLSPQLKEVRILMSPSRKLSDEILCNIFEHVVDAQKKSVRYSNSLDITKGPWLPSYVCRRWRQISLSRPSLWADVAVRIEPRDPDSEELVSLSTGFLLGLQLVRSGQCLLDVQLYCGDIFVGHTNPFIMILGPSTPRWRQFALVATRASIVALSSALGVFPLLRKVTVRQHIYASRQNSDLQKVPFDLQNAIPWLQHCNRMRTLSYDNFPRDSRFRATSWDLLQALNITNCRYSLHTLLHMLEQTSNLESLLMDQVYIDLLDPEKQIQSPVILSKLGRLRLLSSSSPGCKREQEHTYVPLLNFIAAPLLQHLEATVSESNSRAFTEFIQRSECALISFGLDFCLNESHFDIRPLMQSMRGVQSMTILKETDNLALVLETLAIDVANPCVDWSEDEKMPVDEQQQQSPLLPQLSALAVEVRVLDDEAIRLFSRVLLSRTSGIGSSVDDGSVQALRKVCLANVRRTSELMETFSRCRAAGMSINCGRYAKSVHFDFDDS